MYTTSEYYGPELVSWPRAFQLGRISRTVSRKVWFSTLSMEVCRREINKCRAKSTSGERSSQRVASLRPDPPRRAVKNSDRCAFFGAYLSIAKNTGRSARSEGRVRGSVKGLGSSGTRSMDGAVST